MMNKEILIIPYYLYTHFSIYQNLLKNISLQNKIELLYYSFNRNLDKLNYPYLDKLNHTKINLIKTSSQTNVFLSIIKIPVHLINILIIQLAILLRRPKLIILGSDLGGFYIRVLQYLNQNCKFLVIQSTKFLKTERREEIEPKFKWPIKNLIYFLKLDKLIFHSNDTPGSFNERAIVACQTTDYFTAISKYNRNVFIYDYQEAISTNEGFDLINIEETIVLYTEALHEVTTGIDFNSVYKQIIDQLLEVKKLTGKNIAIKYHPRESRPLVSYIRKEFGDLYEFNSSIPGENIVSTCLINLAFESAILEISKILGKPYLELNLEDLDKINELIVNKLNFINDKPSDAKSISLYSIIHDMTT